MKLNYVLAFILSGSFFTLSLANAAECQHRILLVPQIHASSIGGGTAVQITPQWFEKTAQSQFSIAQYLMRHKDLPVFSEQISSDKSMETVNDDFKRIIPPLIKSYFPNGLPSSYMELSFDQKNFLAKAGGDLYGLVTGSTSLLHRVVENDQVENDLMGKISNWVQQHPYAAEYSPEISNLIFNTRENLALDQVNQFLSSHPSQKDVVLIFGKDHSTSFHSHAGKFPPECIVTPTEFQSVNDSLYGASPSGTEPYSSNTAK